MYQLKGLDQLLSLKKKAETIINEEKERDPRVYLDTCFELECSGAKFFPAQFKLCKQLTEKACRYLVKNNNGDFEIYKLLCNAGIKFFLKDPNDRNPAITLFAYQKMKETKEKSKHMKAMLKYWLEIKKFLVGID